MAGLVLAIRVFAASPWQVVDARHEAGHDGVRIAPAEEAGVSAFAVSAGEWPNRPAFRLCRLRRRMAE
jgi:hypothetical protein